MTIPATAYPPPVRNGEVYRGDWLVEQSEQLRCRVMAQRSLGADPQHGRPQDGLPRGYSGERCVDPLVKRLPATASQPAIDRGRRHSRVKCLLPREHSGLSVDELPASGSQIVGHPASLPKLDADKRTRTLGCGQHLPLSTVKRETVAEPLAALHLRSRVA